MKYKTLVVDPPWAYADKLGDGPRGAASHYDVAGVDEIMGIPIGTFAEDDAHLYLWATNAFLVEAHVLAKAWGFQMRTMLTWVKSNGFGLGHYYRNSTEHVLFCVRGTLPCARKDVPTHFMAPRGRHSEKPAAFYDMVQTMSPGPYLDVFARKQRFNFDTWGNECYLPEGMTL